MLSYPDFKEKSVIVVFSTEGQYFSIKNDNLIVKGKDDEVILQCTCYRILALWVVGHGTLSSGLMTRSKKFAFPIYLLTPGFRLIGVWNSPTEGNFLLRQRQYAYKGWGIARHLVKNKIDNQIFLLKSIRKKRPVQKRAIALLQAYRDEVNSAVQLNEILGLEGIASRVYFENWFDNLEWKGRKPRAKQDIVNVVLDMGYTMLFYFIENMLHLYGFDIYQGVYHRNFYKRKSLVCDIQEPFRCIIDHQVKRAFNLGQIKESDFIVENGQYRLNFKNSKAYTQWMLQSLLKFKSPIFHYTQGYYRSFIRSQDVAEFPVFNLELQK